MKSYNSSQDKLTILLRSIDSDERDNFEKVIESCLEEEKQELFSELINHYSQNNNIHKLFTFSLSHQKKELVQFIFDNNYLEEKLMNLFFRLALSEDKFDIAKSLIISGFNVDYGLESRDASIIDCSIANVDVVKFLINECEANPLAKNKKGKTILNLLATIGDLDSIAEIVESIKSNFSLQTTQSVGFMLGIDVADDNGNTPLLNAVIQDEIVTAKYLVESLGADPEVRNNNRENIFIITENFPTENKTRKYVQSIREEGMSYEVKNTVPSSSCQGSLVSLLNRKYCGTSSGK
ncbi:MAG: ankyrin repeat domain-containing protein [Pelagibacterales bacterium]|nr:ankyrin repeat domain-containing protein [Pelagibacterales bacterium]